jgi:hypothetical protein
METQQCVLFSIVVEAKHFVMPIPSAIVTTWHHFTQRKRFYSEFTTPATINVLALCVSAWHLCQILSKMGFSRQIFITAPTSNFTENRRVAAE